MMKIKKKAGAIVSVITAVILLLVQCLPVHVYAQDIDLTKKDCSVAAVLTDGKNYISGSTLEIYRAADIVKEDEKYHYAYTEAFSKASEAADISRDDIDFEIEKKSIAGALDDILNKGTEISPEGVEVTDKNGRVLFAGLSPGMYLIRQKSRAPGYYRLPSFVVTVPVKNNNGTDWNYNVDAVPKMEKITPFAATADPEVQQFVDGNHPDDVTCHYVIVSDKDSYPSPGGGKEESGTATVKNDGVAKFGTIVFDEPGTYSYTVYEKKGTDQDATYDGNVYKIVYEVDEDGNVKKSVLQNDVKISDGERTVFRIVYNNNSPSPSPAQSSVPAETDVPSVTDIPSEKTPVPSAVPQEVKESPKAPEVTGNPSSPIPSDSPEKSEKISAYGNPSVTKIITGNIPGKAEKFVFYIRPEEESLPVPKGSLQDSEGAYKKVTVKGTGSAEFGRITFTSPGTYSYVVTEKKGSDSNFTYDTNKYRIVYKVKKSGKISMKVLSPHGKNVSSGDGAVINNHFKGKTSIPRDQDKTRGNPPAPGKKKNTPARLPQTGQLWWPVWILSGAGVILTASGFIINSEDRKKLL